MENPDTYIIETESLSDRPLSDLLTELLLDTDEIEPSHRCESCTD